MIKKLLPILLALVGVALGGGAGFFLRPAPEPAEQAAEGGAAAAEGAAKPEAATEPAEGAEEGEAGPEYVKLANQFVVPLIIGGKVGAMVILSLSIEVEAGTSTDAFTKEPKLRDTFLRVMFDHANAGGFDGSFTDSANMIALRKALLEAAQGVLGDTVSDVLVTDIVRQDT